MQRPNLISVYCSVFRYRGIIFYSIHATPPFRCISAFRHATSESYFGVLQCISVPGYLFYTCNVHHHSGVIRCISAALLFISTFIRTDLQITGLATDSTEYTDRPMLAYAMAIFIISLVWPIL